MKLKEAFKLSSIPVLFASLCCLAPVILVALGISTASFAASLSDTLYGDYKWVFRSVGLVALAFALFWHFRKKKGICTLDQAKRERRQIINTVLLTFVIGVLGYIFWLYVVVEWFGVVLGIWEWY